MSYKILKYPTIASLISKEIITRAVVVALVLGSILTLVNQPDAIFGNAVVEALPLMLVYMTPFVVVTASQVLGSRRAIRDSEFSYGWKLHDVGFVGTAMSHGIPIRAMLLAALIGAINTVITVAATLTSDGIISDLQKIAIAQAFALPLLFGLVSQTISYRRAIAAINHQRQSPPLST